MHDLNMLTVCELKAMLDAGRCSAVEAVGDVLAAAKTANPDLNAYLEINEEDALEQARKADSRRAAGKGGSLLGVPIALKDMFSVKGQSCRCASRILDGYVAPYDATCVARLRDAGAVLVGRTNMDEFGMGSSSENSAFGATRNPWDLNRVAGGSSSGAAAAVAADMAVGALGSDTGGSARLPASFCGCVGMMPSYGRISRYGMAALASSMDQAAPLTKDVHDAALLLGVMAGHDANDATSVDAPVPDYLASLETKGMHGLRLGLPRELVAAAGLDDDVALRINEAAKLCESLGASLVDLDLQMIRHAVAAYIVLLCAEASSSLARFDGVRYGYRTKAADDLADLYDETRANGFGLEVKRRILLGTFVLGRGCYDEYYIRAQKARTLIRRDFARAFSGCDLMIAPVSPVPAFKMGECQADPLQMYLSDALTVPASLAGLCALSVPCGFSASGLPIGMQMIGPALVEERLLQAACAYEAAAGWRGRKPAFVRPAQKQGEQ